MMMMTKRMACLSAIAAALLMTAAPTSAEPNIEAGGLTCRSAGGEGFVVGSVLHLDCVFVPALGGPELHYAGVIHRYGIDLGKTKDVTLAWAVFAPTGAIRPGDLAGVYGGVQGNASVGVGGGANAMLGGSNNTFALQPVSAEGQTGLNLSVGVTELELHLVDGPRRRHHKN
jgi:hypothetical protein